MQIVKVLKYVQKLQKVVRNMQSFEAEVVDNEDPEGLQRIKVMCTPVYGQEVCPWCTSKDPVVGDSIGIVNTPQVGDYVSITLRGGNSSQPQWEGGFRSSKTPPPSEFSDPKVNGEKTSSGITITKDDTDGSYKITVPQGAEVYLDGGGTLHLTGVTVVTHGVTKLNNGEFGVATTGHICPYTGSPHIGSLTVKATL